MARFPNAHRVRGISIGSSTAAQVLAAMGQYHANIPRVLFKEIVDDWHENEHARWLPLETASCGVIPAPLEPLGFRAFSLSCSSVEHLNPDLAKSNDNTATWDLEDKHHWKPLGGPLNAFQRHLVGQTPRQGLVQAHLPPALATIVEAFLTPVVLQRVMVDMRLLSVLVAAGMDLLAPLARNFPGFTRPFSSDRPGYSTACTPVLRLAFDHREKQFPVGAVDCRVVSHFRPGSEPSASFRLHDFIDLYHPQGPQLGLKHNAGMLQLRRLVVPGVVLQAFATSDVRGALRQFIRGLAGRVLLVVNTEMPTDHLVPDDELAHLDRLLIDTQGVRMPCLMPRYHAAVFVGFTPLAVTDIRRRSRLQTEFTLLVTLEQGRLEDQWHILEALGCSVVGGGPVPRQPQLRQAGLRCPFTVALVDLVLLHRTFSLESIDPSVARWMRATTVYRLQRDLGERRGALASLVTEELKAVEPEEFDYARPHDEDVDKGLAAADQYGEWLQSGPPSAKPCFGAASGFLKKTTVALVHKLIDTAVDGCHCCHSPVKPVVPCVGLAFLRDLVKQGYVLIIVDKPSTKIRLREELGQGNYLVTFADHMPPCTRVTDVVFYDSATARQELELLHWVVSSNREEQGKRERKRKRKRKCRRGPSQGHDVDVYRLIK